MKLEIESVSKRYGTQAALQSLSLSIENAHCLALIGPSGGGKSTCLRLLAGLETPDSGYIRINGQVLGEDDVTLKSYRKRVGVVFQAYNLFPHYDALTNIALPLEKVHGFKKVDAIEKAKSALDQLQLADHGSKRPAELSGGQNQRVAIARALAPDPDLIFLDEPTSALDPEMTAEVLSAIDRLIAAKKDLVIATHQMGFAKRAADRIAFIADGQLVESGPAPALIEQPQTERCKKFLGACLET